jgi:hypothetical protein
VKGEGKGEGGRERREKSERKIAGNTGVDSPTGMFHLL